MSTAYNGDGGKKMLDFVRKEQQEAVVLEVKRLGTERTYVVCFSPVWGDMSIELPYLSRFDDYHRGDIIVVKQKVNSDEYFITENKTRQEIKIAGIDKIMKGFTQFERDAIMKWCHTTLKTNEK